jgi:hypothetical protein
MRIFTVSFASVYPHYVAKVEKKGRTQAELGQVIEWLTGFDQAALNGHLTAGTTFEDIDDPLMQKIRYLDKLVDELAKGRSMDKVLRT